MSHRRVAVLLVVLGLAVLAHPLYLFPHHGQSSVFVLQYEEVGSEPPGDSVVAYADLPPDAQRALDAAHESESSTLWRGDDDAAIDALGDAQYLDRDGTYYEYDLGYGGGIISGIGTSIRVFLTGLGSLALVVGALVARTGSFRPLAPRSALAVPVVAGVAVAATNAYDTVFSGASESFLMVEETFGPVALLGVAAGSALSRDDWRAIGFVVALALVGSVAAFATGANPWMAGFVAAPLAFPAVVFGFLLTNRGRF
ncbi:hypothetical protein [Halorussus amylolyticus]|uniref:hypothetical protein n=1 Tax=Halorussus amylolyticus TaxID=1126242 RepID=UPI00104A5339|nr:hypothetical protein [Halorussus amylolyticus]